MRHTSLYFFVTGLFFLTVCVYSAIKLWVIALKSGHWSDELDHWRLQRTFRMNTYTFDDELQLIIAQGWRNLATFLFWIWVHGYFQAILLCFCIIYCFSSYHSIVKSSWRKDSSLPLQNNELLVAWRSPFQSNQQGYRLELYKGDQPNYFPVHFQEEWKTMNSAYIPAGPVSFHAVVHKNDQGKLSAERNEVA